jgi:hypothetical protein
MSPTKLRLLALLSGALAAGSASPARGQAWLPPKGEAWISLGYGNAFSTKHYFGVIDPGEIDVGHIRGQSVGLQLGYALSNRLTFSASLPYMIYKYEGAFPHPTTQDDGHYHGTFQDYHLTLSYQLVNGGYFAVAPLVAVVIPSHSYEYFAHAAVGKNLHEYLVGFAAGARLDRIVPGSYVQARYAYAFVEKIQGISHDLSDVAVEAGYFLTPQFRAQLLGTGYFSHGGLEFHSPFDLPPDLLPYHDQIGKSSQVNVGGGLSYALTGSTEVFAAYAKSVYGRDGHKIDQGLSFGVSYSFSPGQLVRRYFQKTIAAPLSGTP